MRSYVDAGGNILTAKDIFDSLHYGSGLKNTKVCVVEIMASKSIVVASKIKNISFYHSVRFNEKTMTFWRYFGVDKGVEIPYSDEFKFQSGATVIVPFSSTCQISNQKQQARC